MSGMFRCDTHRQGNNTEAIRENGGIISQSCIISTDSSIMHNLHRFNNTPCALILSQLEFVCCFGCFACVPEHGFDEEGA